MAAEGRRLDEDEVTLMLGEDVLANALRPGPLGGRAAAQHHGNVAGLVARCTDQAGILPLGDETLVEETQDVTLAASLDTLAGTAEKDIYPHLTPRRDRAPDRSQAGKLHLIASLPRSGLQQDRETA